MTKAKFRSGELVYIRGTEEGPFEIMNTCYKICDFDKVQILHNLYDIETGEIQYFVDEDDLEDQGEFFKKDFRRRRKEREQGTKLTPCECKDNVNVRRLNEQGIGHNEYSLEVHPNRVILRTNDAELRIPQNIFEKFARWYLEPQELKEKK
jgi:ribonucleotide reductase alpha subunit